MGAFGERLRREREMRGVSLEEIAATTKIGTRLLRALEEENFDLLPGGIFNKSYVRSYCKFVGLNEEQGVADYLEASGETAPDVRVIARQNASARAERPVSSGGSFPLVPMLIIVVAAAAAAGGWHLLQERHQEPAAKQPISGADTAAESGASPTQGLAGKSSSNPEISPPAGNATSSVDTHSTRPMQKPSAVNPAAAADATGALTPAGAPFEVTVTAKDRAWVAIKSDGKIMVRGIIKSPDVKVVRASNEVVLWTGNAGAVEVSFNGKHVPLSGGPNDEQMLTFNSQGLLPGSTHP